jgi:hypothetical protein
MELIEVSSSLRYFLVAWSILTLTFSLAGNITVLIATMKYKAIKFDKVSVILIENIATADLGDTIFVILPTTWAILADQSNVAHFFSHNKFGELLCYGVAHLQYLFPLASSVMICALNVSKLSCLIFPLRARNRSSTMGYLIAAAAWGAYLIRFAVSLWDHDKVIYGHWEKGFRCGTDELESTSQWVDVVMGLLTVGLPGVLLILTLSLLLCHVHRLVGLQRQAVLVNILISTTFILSFAPYVARMLWIAAGVSTNSHPASCHLWLTAIFINYVLCFSNPVIGSKGSSWRVFERFGTGGY